MLNIIKNNPFRILGVFANAPKKDIIASKGKLFAFARIGKQIPCATNLSSLLPDITRTSDNLTESENKLSLAKDIVHYAQFWFVNDSFTDKNALSFIENNQKDKAINAWKENSLASSFHNRIVYYLIVEDYVNAFVCAETLYGTLLAQYKTLFNDCMTATSGKELFTSLCETIYQEDVLDDKKWNDIFKNCKSQEFRECINHVRASSHINTINDAILVAKSKSNDDKAFDVGTELVSKTNDAVDELENVLGRDNAQCQLTFDKLANAILGYGIDYYNSHQSEYKVANKVLPLFQRSYDLAVTNMQVERSKTNLDIIKRAIVPESSPTTNPESATDDKVSFLKKFVAYKDIVLGKCSINDIENKGVGVDDSYGWKTANYEELSLQCTNGGNVFNQFVFYSWKNRNILSRIGASKSMVYNDFLTLLKRTDLKVEEIEKPHLSYSSDSLRKYFSAKIQAYSFIYNVKLRFEIFSEVDVLKTYASIFEKVDIGSIYVTYDDKQPCHFHKWFYTSESTKSLSPIETVLKPFLKYDNFLLGKTTKIDFILAGIHVEDTGNDWYTARTESYVAFDNHKTGVFDEIFVNVKNNEQKFKLAGIEGERDIISWVGYFMKLGINVSISKYPENTKDDIGFIECKAELAFRDTDNNLSVIFDLYKLNLIEKNAYTTEMRVNRMRIALISKHSTCPFHNWYIGNCATNSPYSKSVSRNKTLQQLIKHPLGDESILYSNTNYEEICRWIRREGKISDLGASQRVCSFNSPSTTYRQKKITEYIFSDRNNARLSIINIDFSLYDDTYNRAKNMEEVYDFCQQASKELSSIGFVTQGGKTNDIKTKFDITGTKSNTYVRLALEQESYKFCKFKIVVRE